MLTDGGYAGFSFHFDSIGGDGRFKQLPLLAASDLMADGYGYAAEGDTNTASLMCAAQTLIGDAHFSEMYAMDWELDSVLISHMGEGNWKIARGDRPVRLIDRPLGIGRLDNPPTPVFSAEPGPATSAALVPLEGEYYRLVVGHGEVLDTPELPKVEMHYFHFRPERGMETFMDDWLRLGCAAPLRDQPRRARRHGGAGWRSCSTWSTRRSEPWTGPRCVTRSGPGGESGAAGPRPGDADLGQRQRDRPGAGLVAIKPSGVSYETMTASGHGDRRPRRQRHRGRAAPFDRHAHAPGSVPRVRADRGDRPHALDLGHRVGAGPARDPAARDDARRPVRAPDPADAPADRRWRSHPTTRAPPARC